jgi:excisionase family DNA binding protein
MESKTQVKIIVDANDLVTVPKAADIIGVHFATVYRLIKKNLLHGIYIGEQVYLSVKEVEQFKSVRDVTLKSVPEAATK